MFGSGFTFTNGFFPDIAFAPDGNTLYVGFGDTVLAITPVGLDEDGDGVLDEDDVCPGSPASDPAAGVPSHSLATNRWADLDGDHVFDTNAPWGNGPELSFTIDDTGGCTCSQIIDELGLGNGHTRFGCSIGAMQTWVDLVSD